MDCRTLGGFQACLCGTSGCSAKLSLPRAGGWQRNIKAKLVSRVKPLAAAALAYFLPKREIFNAHHEMIERVAIIPLGLCAITYRLLATLLHYRAATPHHSNLARVPCLHIIAGRTTEDIVSVPIEVKLLL